MSGTISLSADESTGTLNRCQQCGKWYHEGCHMPPLGRAAFEGDWFCQSCVVKHGMPARHA